MTIPDPRAQRAYQLYVDDGLSLRAVARIVQAAIQYEKRLDA